MADEYVQRTVIVKHKRDEGKVKRFVVNPVKRVLGSTTEDKKKERVAA